MLKNCVFKVSVDNRKWLKAAGIRAVKTVAQAAIAGIGTAAALGQVDWKYVNFYCRYSGSRRFRGRVTPPRKRCRKMAPFLVI